MNFIHSFSMCLNILLFFVQISTLNLHERVLQNWSTLGNFIGGSFLHWTRTWLKNTE